MARKKNSKAGASESLSNLTDAQDFYEGHRLDDLLLKLKRSIEEVPKGGLPEKIWIKQQFAVGVNDVTRVLERMNGSKEEDKEPTRRRKAPLVPLQAVLLASDCNPRWLTKHVPSLAYSRQVPIIFVKDNKGGSLRLGSLVKLRTAMAIGIKAKGSIINNTIHEVLSSQAFTGEPSEEV